MCHIRNPYVLTLAKLLKTCNTTGVLKLETPMNSTIIILFNILDITAELIQLTYETGVFTRRYILPVVLFVLCGLYHYGNKLWDYMTTETHTLKHYATPLTTGLAKQYSRTNMLSLSHS